MDVRSLKLHEIGSFPYIELNVNRLLTIMEPKVLAMIIALSFFEVPLFICIENIPVLSSVMHIIAQLSYPFNDNSNFSKLLFISEKMLLEKRNIELPGGTFSNIIGIYGTKFKISGAIYQLDLKQNNLKFSN